MKTKLLFVLLLIGGAMMGQEKNDTDLAKQEISVLFSQIKNIDATIKSEEQLLKKYINNSEITKKIISRIEVYVENRNTILSAIDSKKATLLSTLSEDETKISKGITALEGITDKTKKNKADLKEKKALLQDVKNDIAIIKEVNVKKTNLKKAEGIDNDLDNLTYLNAYNFDFNATDKTSGYLGNLNLFFNIKNSNTTKWYINAGLKKIDYAFSNNSVSEDIIDNIKLNPLQNVSVPGDKYLTEYNRYTTSTKIKTWSGYFQLLHKITKIKNLYLHAHTELQISKVDFKTTIQTLDTVTNTVINPSNIPVLYNTLDKQYDLDKTYFGYYFGVGVTGDFVIVDNSDYKLRYFVQATMGFSNIKPGNSKSINDFQTIKENYSDFTSNFESNKHLFHLFNTYVSNKINGLDLIVGSEIRGNFISPPLYIFYVGVNTDLDKIAKLFQQ